LKTTELRALSTLLLIFNLFILNQHLFAQKSQKAIIAYYAGSPEKLDNFDAKLMTHIIYCFGHLEGNRIKIKSNRDTLIIQKMVALKIKNPQLKVLVSLGGRA
jgi:chitinase